MANLEEEDIIEDDSFRTVLSFPPEVQEAIDQVLEKWVQDVGVALRLLAIISQLALILAAGSLQLPVLLHGVVPASKE